MGDDRSAVVGVDAVRCDRCKDSGWRWSDCVCDCRAGDYAWARWQGYSIEEYDRRAAGTSDYHGDDPAFMPEAEVSS